MLSLLNYLYSLIFSKHIIILLYVSKFIFPFMNNSINSNFLPIIYFKYPILILFFLRYGTNKIFKYSSNKL